MILKSISSTFLCIALFFFSNHSLLPNDELVPIPNLEHRVTDLTNTLSITDKSAIEKLLRDFQDETGTEIVTLIVPTVKPEDISQYSIRVVEKWKIGREKIDDGILLLIALNDHKVRIEVGYGLEGVITDIKSNQIIRNIIAPYFKEQKYTEGITQGIQAIIKLAKGEALPKPTKHSRIHGGGHNKYLIFIIALVFLALISQNFLGANASSILTTLAGIVIGYFFLNLIVGILFGIFASIVTRSGMLGGFGLPMGFGGGSGNGSNNDFFSGGGGSFGGGGSSGDW